MRISVMVTHLAHNQGFTFDSWFATKVGNNLCIAPTHRYKREGRVKSSLFSIYSNLHLISRQVVRQVKTCKILLINNVPSSSASSNQKTNMKKILIATLLIGMVSGCAKNEIEKNEKRKGDSNGLPWGVVVFTWEKHQYVACRNAGLVHSESCSNPIHKEKKSN